MCQSLQAVVTEYHIHLFLTVLERREAQDQGAGSFGLTWEPASWIIDGCLLSHMAERKREREGWRGALLVSSYKITNLMKKASSSWPNDFPKAHFKYHGGVEPLQHMNFWRTHSVHGNNEYRKPFNKKCVCFLSHQNYLSCIFLDSNMLLNTLNVIEMNLFSVDHMPWFPQYIWVSAYYPGGVINNTSFYCQICSSLGNKLYDQHLYYQYFKDIFVP